jgi:ubiquitin-protein ligase/DNA-directed RNA polymerase subunit RPC12/RpoP
MSSPRVRRLQNDYERVSTRFDGWPIIFIDFKKGVPPDMYRIGYKLKGLHTSPDGRILERNEHVLEIRLGLEYPRRAPQLRMLTPVFHPNFDQTEVCAQDIYAASEGLDDLVIRIGRMIAYQDYNTKSPLNGIAAKWADENRHRLPVDDSEIAPPAPETKSSFAPPPIAPQVTPPESTGWDSKIVIENDQFIPATGNDDELSLEFDCPYCQLRLRSPRKDAGTVVECPYCHQALTVPDGDASPKELEPETIEFSCPHCTRELEVQSDVQGELECPACHNPIIIGRVSSDRTTERQ